MQTSSKFRLSFVCAENEAREDLSFCHSRLNLLLLFNKKGQSDKSPHGLNIVRVPRIWANFPFVCPPLECRSGIGICGREEWLLRIGRYKGHRRPLGIHQRHSKLEGKGRLMLVHNSFKHHLEVETWFPVHTKDTHTDDLLSPTKYLALASTQRPL